MEAWVRAGGTLIRFAGPLLIQGPDAPGQDQAHADTLLPVPLMGASGCWVAPCPGAGRNTLPLPRILAVP
ncbi:hypothetical protein RAA17_20495 [Komagataeibacter rhaeticus]|nr:hypothetical protein [Komagataeibacter rhaeticus]